MYHQHQRRPSQQQQQQQHSTNMRVLSSQDADSLLSNFPTTRLSYEVSIHKNDKNQHQNSDADAGAGAGAGYTCFLLPKGRRCIAWATEWRRNKIFAVIEIDNMSRGRDERSISPIIRKFHQDNGWLPGRVRILDACFDRTLVYGTVFGGVLFKINEHRPSDTVPPQSQSQSQFFSIHTIYWYKGNPVPPLTASGHIHLCEDIFAHNDIRQVAYTKQNSVVFGLPVLCNTEQDAENLARILPYETFAIQYRYFTHTRVFQQILQERPSLPAPSRQHVHSYIPPAPIASVPSASVLSASKCVFIQPPDEMLTNIQATFIVRPNIQNDIYELFVLQSGGGRGRCEYVFHNFAHISGYKTSVMMNRLFRNITENERLDTMEESEDESEFENTEPDKYVTLTKEYKMICRFNKRFCRWVPIEIASKGDIITDYQVKQHEIRYTNYRRIK
jgi:hypothetical protein